MKRRTTNASWRRIFTLLELVLGLGIIGILLALTLPAFLKLTRGSAVDTATGMIASQLRLARAEAISRRQYIAVVMPGREFENSAATADSPIFRYQSFRAALVTKEGEDFVFTEWYPGTTWTFLPRGAIIAEVNTQSREGSEGDWFIDNEGCITVEVRDNSDNDEDSAEGTEEESDSTRYRAVIFRPDGRSVQMTYVTILEGVNTIPDSVEPPEQDENQDEFIFEGLNKQNLQELEVSHLTGKIHLLP